MLADPPRGFAQLFAPLLALLLLFAPSPASAQSLGHYYCWAPDPATDTVHVSPIRPTGPIPERAGYGHAFAAQLKARGVTGITLPAYCTMRTTLGEVQRAKAALPKETCTSCQGATRFVEAPWSTDAILPPPPPRAIAGRSNTPQQAPKKPAPDAVQPPLPPMPGPIGPVVVVLVNSETGAVVAQANKPDLLALVREEAFSMRETGWKTLLVSSEPGLGVVICEEKDGRFLHHVSHGQPTVNTARQDAMASAGLDPQDTSIKPCKAWRAFPASPPAVDKPESVIDTIKGAIRKKVTEPESCPKTCPPKTKRGLACMCVRG